MAAANRARAEAQKIAVERRLHPRVPGAPLAWIDVARVKHGPEVRIINLSTGGVLLESDRPLPPGSPLSLEIVGAYRSTVVPFAILRSRISVLRQRGAIFRSACVFSKPLALPELGAAESGVLVSASVLKS
jgi:hypothetical protein